MQKALIFGLVSSLLLAVGLVVAGPSQMGVRVAKQPQTVPYVDLQKYLGVWYEQAVIPFYFERGCINTQAIYSLRDDGNIRVDNKCTRNGKLVESVGKAIPEDSTHAKLKVEFVQTLDIGGQYWVVRLADDYSYSVVSSPDYKLLWILCRQPHMPESTFNAIFEDLKKDGFAVDKL